MEWVGFDNGATIGKIGSESGMIIQDSEHPLGARITLERGGNIAPYSITCGVYGCMCHTRFFSTESEAVSEFNLMATALDSILQASTTGDSLIDDVGKFVEEFP